MLLCRALASFKLPGLCQGRFLKATTSSKAKDVSPEPSSNARDERGDTTAEQVVDPNQNHLDYLPEGKGQDPADQGLWLKPGDTGYVPRQERPPLVEDKITGEKVPMNLPSGTFGIRICD